MKDISGYKFGRLSVIRFMGRRSGSCYIWECRCDCGRIVNIIRSNLFNKNTTQCKFCSALQRVSHGCVRKKSEYSLERATWRAWTGIKLRCLNPKEPSYKNYGGRGISICNRWMDFKNFLQDMGVKPSKELSIDRIDNNRGYEPGNCRWATRRVQNLNKRKPSEIKSHANS